MDLEAVINRAAVGAVDCSAVGAIVMVGVLADVPDNATPRTLL